MSRCVIRSRNWDTRFKLETYACNRVLTAGDLAMGTILTIGYGGKKPADFFSEIEEMAPDYIVDVRENPHSAYLGCYTKAHLMKRFDTRYVWIKDLGNRTRTLPPQLVNEEAGMAKLEELCEGTNKIVLLCAEKDEERCHRSYVKERIVEILKSHD